MAIRNYHMADADMFQKSRTKRQHFINHKAAFVAFDADFDDPFADDWQDAIEASEGFETAETRDDGGRQETAEVLDVMNLAHQKHIEMKYFVQKAFATKPALMNKIGLDDYDDARSSQQKMSVYLQNLYTQTNSATYKPALLAANCTQAKIDAILTIKSNLNTQDTEQNVYLENESVATKARIDQHNSTVGFWQKVNAASKSLFYGQPELLNLFLFPRNTEPSSSFNVLGVITNPANAVVPDATVQIEVLGLSTTSDNNGEYGFAAVPPGSYSLKVSKPGHPDVFVPFTITAGNTVTVNATLLP